MNSMPFMDMVRQYARLARERRKSYAETVLALRALRFESIDREVSDPALNRAAKRSVDAFLAREYAANDDQFTVEAVG